MDLLDTLEELQHLAVVQKVMVELNNHLNLNDKVLAEFIIELANESDSLATFRQKLSENEAGFSDGLSASLFNIIQREKVRGKERDRDVQQEDPEAGKARDNERDRDQKDRRYDDHERDGSRDKGRDSEKGGHRGRDEDSVTETGEGQRETETGMEIEKT